MDDTSNLHDAERQFSVCIDRSHNPEKGSDPISHKDDVYQVAAERYADRLRRRVTDAGLIVFAR